MRDAVARDMGWQRRAKPSVGLAIEIVAGAIGKANRDHNCPTHDRLPALVWLLACHGYMSVGEAEPGLDTVGIGEPQY